MNSKYSHYIEIKHSTTVFMYLTANAALEILDNAEL